MQQSIVSVKTEKKYFPDDKLFFSLSTFFVLFFASRKNSFNYVMFYLREN